MLVVTDAPRDGREGHQCRDCGAYLHWWTWQGQTYLRCPWVKGEGLFTSQVEHGFVTRIFCERPYRVVKKQEGGVSTVTPKHSW